MYSLIEYLETYTKAIDELLMEENPDISKIKELDKQLKQFLLTSIDEQHNDAKNKIA